MSQYTKLIGKVKISDPDDVQSKCTELGIDYYKGLVFCTAPEIGFLNTDLVPCRYGLSVPYIRVQEDWELLIEPTIIDYGDMKKRWFYTGIADCGGKNSVVEPDTDMQLLIQLVSQVIYASGTTLHFSAQDADEPFVLGNQLKSWAEDVDSAIQGIMDAITNAATGTQDGGAAFKANIIAAFPSASAWTDDALSEKIFGEQ
jgi:hypothetical protein